MIVIPGKKIIVAGLLFAALIAGTVSLHAQCTYYVSTGGTDRTSYDASYGTSTSTAFLTLQGAHDYIEMLSPLLGQQAITVCVESGDYYAKDYVNNNGAPFTTGSDDVLDISLSGGGPTTVVTFTPDQGAYVTLHQTGWNAINFAPSATSVPSYVTVTGFNIQGQAYTINGDSAMNQAALARTGSPTPQAFYDGNCIAITGVYQGTTDSNHPYVGIPNHIVLSNNVISACGGGGIGTIEADYLTISGNSVIDCSWYSIYGTSGISLLDSVDIDGVQTEKNLVTNNWVTGNYEQVPWVSAGKITDGEGIIIDTNLNSSGTQNPQFNGGNIPAYGGRTLVANNVIWGNGSSAIEVFESQHVDVEGNSTYGNVFYQWTGGAFQGRGELSVSDASDVTVANNVFESVAPSSGYLPTSYPVSGVILPGGWAWFENNVYYGGPGYSAAADYYGATNTSEATPSGIPAFYEGVGEQLNLDPGYVATATTPNTWPPRIDLRVTAAKAAATGCTEAGAVCDAPALDILGYARSASGYAAGAYASTAQ
jgi:hypothetical protein